MARFKVITVVTCSLGVLASPAHAGMTVITLTDLAEARLESISFFLFLYLLLALVIMILWNYLGKTFIWMPRINYPRSLALMLVSGLFLYVILTMISGARELLTPGAWKKQGIGYELNDGGALQPPQKEKRRAALSELRDALWSYAEKHSGSLPAGRFDSSFPTSLWELPGTPGYYAYMSGVTPGGGRRIIAYEPAVMGVKRYVLLADGSIESWSSNKLRRALENHDD